jgi:drug/metabolite transporter (DMT)-like permease
MTNQPALPIIAIIAGEMCFAIMGALIKYMSSELSTETIVFFRNSLALIIIIPLILQKLGPSGFRSQQMHLHLLRGTIGVAAMSCFFYILGRMHFTEAILLKLCTPFFIPLIALAWLRERSSATTWFAIFLGFIGVAIISEPKMQGNLEDSFGELSLVGIGLIGACLAGLAKVTIRRMGDSEPALRTVFYFGLFASLASLPFAANAWTQPDLTQWLLLFALASIATIGQLLVTYAYKRAAAGKIGQYTYTSLIFTAAIGWAFWGEIITLAIFLGSSCIIIAGIINLKSK